MVTPRVFVSHASEDKDRFVLPFATELRVAGGIDAWVDVWELKPGDSLIEGVMQKGLDGSDSFIVVLSRISLKKPWVQIEREIAMERHIHEPYRIIPVLLDGLTREEIPTGFKHLVWVAHRGDVAATAADVMRGLRDETTSRPPLGSPPAYLNRPGEPAPLTENKADDAVLAAILTAYSQFDGPSVVFITSDVAQALTERGITTRQFDESMHALTAEGVLHAQHLEGQTPGRWLVGEVPSRTWLALAEQSGTDVDALSRRIVARAVNSQSHADLRIQGFEGRDYWTLNAVCDHVSTLGLVKVTRTDQVLTIVEVSPLARRWLNS